MCGVISLLGPEGHRGAEVAVIGVPDEKWGESVKAVVALDHDVPEKGIDRVRQGAARRLHKCPKSVDIVDALPRNPTGKIVEKDLRKPYGEGRGRATVQEPSVRFSTFSVPSGVGSPHTCARRGGVRTWRMRMECIGFPAGR